MDPRPYALMRLLICACLVVDLAELWRLDLIDPLFHTYAQGGLSKVQDAGWVADRWLGAQAGPLLFWSSLVLFALVGLGVGGPWLMIAAVLIYGQLGHLFPPGDRGIDRFLRNMLLWLAFSGVDRSWSVLGRWRPAPTSIPRWTDLLIRWSMVLIYLSAGTSKLMQTPRWLAVSGTPVVYRVVTDPMAGALDPVGAWDWAWAFHMMGWATIFVECSSPLLLTRWAPYWAIPAFGMHLGIAATMELGMFSWGMMSIYPPILWPLIRRWWPRARTEAA
jgi:hypothetical protein